MNIYINNKEYALEQAVTISDALSRVPNIPTTGIAIALNNEVVPATEWGKKVLADGDKLTVIKAFYGG